MRATVGFLRLRRLRDCDSVAGCCIGEEAGECRAGAEDERSDESLAPAAPNKEPCSHQIS
jgi:hypothetical protein